MSDFERAKKSDAAQVDGKSTTPKRSVLRAIGLGLITGAADDDCSAIGTYAAAGAKIGPAFLWTAPVLFPMMFAVVYLSAKLGQVSGKGLFGVLRDHYSRWILYPALVGVLIGNTFEAAADLGGMAAAFNLLLPMDFRWTVVGIAVVILSLQIWASYLVISNIFRWLALVLLAYIGSGILAKPEIVPVLKGTFIPTFHFDKEFPSMLVAVIGTTLSAYLYTWQSNQEVEEEIAHGRKRLWQRQGATNQELRDRKRDILSGMFFSNLIMYFIILSTASTLYKSGENDISTAAQAAEALRPLAGNAASILFALGIVGVGFLAIPVMTAGAAYDLAQTVGWRHGLSAKPKDARRFYLCIAGFTVIAVAINFFGFNPMKMLVWSGIAQGFSTPPLMLLIMLMTNNKKVMGEHTNKRGTNILGWVTTSCIFAATLGLVITWFI